MSPGKTALKAGKQEKRCLNSSCGKPFVPGHYGDRQKVGSSKEHVWAAKCGKCKGAGEKLGEECARCRGKGTIRQTCQEWYKGYWSQIRKPPRGIPDGIFSRIEKAASPDRHRHACLIAARESGLRKGELLGLVWGDILDPQGRVRPSFEVSRQWDDSKGLKSMKVGFGKTGYFLPKAVEVVKKLPPGKPEERVFPFYESSIYEWFIHLQEELGIKNPATGEEYRWHDLRHSLGTELVHGHGDKGIALAKEILQHKNVQTTMGYSQKDSGEILAEVAELRAKGRR